MSILNGIKRSVVGKVLYDIRDIYRFPQGMSLIRRIRNCSKNYCILLGTPTFNNIGDHLIALAELKFLEENLKEYQVIEIPTQAFFRYKEVLKDIISTDVPVFITGGGWMGSLWKDDELRMQEMIKTFQDNTITVFPQTVYYENSKCAKALLEQAKKTYKLCRDIHICVREQQSYNFAKNNFGLGEDRIHLVPDMALYLENSFNKCVRDSGKKVLVCMREDQEKKQHWNGDWCVFDMLHQNKIERISTVVSKSIPIWYRKKVVYDLCRKFSEAEFIITDRLHAMIISFLVNRCCIVFDNKTNKVKGVYNAWMINSNKIYFINDYDDSTFQKTVRKLLMDCQQTEIINVSYIEDFRCLKSVARRMIKNET